MINQGGVNRLKVQKQSVIIKRFSNFEIPNQKRSQVLLFIAMEKWTKLLSS